MIRVLYNAEYFVNINLRGIVSGPAVRNVNP